MALILPVIVVLCILAHGRGGPEHADSADSGAVVERPAYGAPACELGRRQFRDLTVSEDEVTTVEYGEADRDQ
tara:strand:+ start:768 stop:986 length:219 start_codon:yes stop_codon:yes gene_type:complete